jgi:hypothetical protein
MYFTIQFLLQIYNNGIRNINLNFIIRELAAPCIAWLGLALAMPYVMSQSIVPLFSKSNRTNVATDILYATCDLRHFQIKLTKLDSILDRSR